MGTSQINRWVCYLLGFVCLAGCHKQLHHYDVPPELIREGLQIRVLSSEYRNYRCRLTLNLRLQNIGTSSQFFYIKNLFLVVAGKTMVPEVEEDDLPQAIRIRYQTQQDISLYYYGIPAGANTGKLSYKKSTATLTIPGPID